jgi:hypothetical protein
MEDPVFLPKQWQTAESPSSLNPNSIDQVEDREMAGWNKRRTIVTGSWAWLPSRDIHRRLVVERKWSSDRYELWLGASLVLTLLNQSSPEGVARGNHIRPLCVPGSWLSLVLEVKFAR